MGWLNDQQNILLIWWFRIHVCSLYFVSFTFFFHGFQLKIINWIFLLGPLFSVFMALLVETGLLFSKATYQSIFIISKIICSEGFKWFLHQLEKLLASLCSCILCWWKCKFWVLQPFPLISNTFISSFFVHLLIFSACCCGFEERSHIAIFYNKRPTLSLFFGLWAFLLLFPLSSCLHMFYCMYLLLLFMRVCRDLRIFAIFIFFSSVALVFPTRMF
jgi:hypothetical protein